ncbi:phytoene desaturase family protein [Arthrobacter sp.]|uniref:phytoene desaturase family protein n=1 Tax=Arthrobacter sp. TaxID=1667 RepID=UPI003A8F2907
MSMPDSRFGVVIVGGGHNGLTAAGYLARAGKSVLVLEKLDQVGGAAVSARAFPGIDANLSRYSYLVSLLPQQIVDDLGLEVSFVGRRYSSYTPDPANPATGLLIDEGSPDATAASFASIGAPHDEAGAFAAFYQDCHRLTRALWPTMTDPLVTRSQARAIATRAGAGDVWDRLIEHPLGEAITGALHSDLARGVVLTDGLIGTFAQAHDADLQQNICFLYHLIGGGTGEWRVPRGGMGVVSAELERAARSAGAVIATGAQVLAVASHRTHQTVTYRQEGSEHLVTAGIVLANVAPDVLDRLSGDQPPAAPKRPNHQREGAQVKVNLLLRRLPRLLDETVTPEAAFGGTFHVNETYGQLQHAYEQAAAGRVPDPLPCEIYCHSLADPSILSPALRDAGAHTLTVFGLHVPDRLVTEDNNEARRNELQAAVFASINSVLAEPLQDLLMPDAEGNPCVETKTTLDIQRALGMPRGNIFHGGLDWPFVEDDAPLDTPAQRWGVATGDPRILICGSGARRGGAVSGLGGHHAAMAVLEMAEATQL